MLRSLTRPVLRPLVRALTEARDFFDPRQLFSASSTIGAIYDYDDLSYLYQKADGSTPVTALEQPVGLVVDQRWGGARGDNKWNAAAASFTGESSQVSSGVYRLYSSAGAYSLVSSAYTVTAGRHYEVSFTVDSVAVAGAGIQFESVVGSPIVASTVGTKRFIVLAASTDAIGLKRSSTAMDVQISNISVRELPGLHAYQTTDAARPVLKGTQRYANLDGTDDRLVIATGGGSTTGFLLVTGINVGGAGTARTIFSDRGTNTGYKVEVDAANNLVFTAGNGASFVSCTGPAITAGTSYVIACWHDGTNLNIKVGSGAVTSQAFATASAGTAAISIGRDNGAATGFYSGRLYPTVYIKDSTATVGAINATMAWVAGKGGIAL